MKFSRRMIYSSTIWTNTIAILVFLGSIVYQGYHERNNQIEQNKKLLFMISAEAQRNLISMHIYSEKNTKFSDYEKCLHLTDINNSDIDSIITSSYGIKNDVYSTLLDKFTSLPSSDLRFVMMYYSNTSDFKTYVRSIDSIIRSKGYDAISHDQKINLLLQYCVQSQTTKKVAEKFSIYR
ncbi:hypothetical protein [Kluyvera georgiana]|uniref:hypothetical protein n=1 Tax=Kluyvera georgiana TaxID=73098 RepID=UPI00321FEB7F